MPAVSNPRSLRLPIQDRAGLNAAKRARRCGQAEAEGRAVSDDARAARTSLSTELRSVVFAWSLKVRITSNTMHK